MRILRYSKLQIQIALDMVKNLKNNDVFVFFMAEGLFFPVIIAKLVNKKSILCLAASMPKMTAHTFKDTLLSKVVIGAECLSYLISDRIIVYSPRLISEWNLEKYRSKILIAHEHFLDFNTFNATTLLSDRPSLIGCIGRLSEEKGAQNFIQALPALLSNRQELCVLIAGDGQLKEVIEASVKEKGVAAHVDLPGWISHENLPKYLNQLRLLVLPSYTEGLPNIMLEAMACGTPVLATPVGAIPDVIIDGKTGFIMENNSPECIAENVIRALNSPDLERIAEEGRRFVEENFTFEKTVEDWKGVLQSIE
jgi:glycosyltransferase involved in cell wall biosynthesis